MAGVTLQVLRRELHFTCLGLRDNSLKNCFKLNNGFMFLLLYETTSDVFFFFMGGDGI